MKSELKKSFENHVWQPFTQMKLLNNPVVVKKAKGSLLYSESGQEIIDAIGSWWVNIHGHCNPKINEAIYKQSNELEHSIFAGLLHEPGIELSKKLSESTNNNLPRVYFSDNGSTGVEIALKMAYQYFWNQGQYQKNKFISLDGGYHGDTIGTMSIGARGVFHKTFDSLLFDCLYVEPPKLQFKNWHSLDLDDNKIKELCTASIQSLENVLIEKSDEICAFILEPIVQAASSGFSMYPPYYIAQAKRLCEKYNVLFIADEVFTGIGRTGRYYACEYAKIWPDIMVLAKGLSGGYLPIAATLCTEKIYKGFYSDDRKHTLFHGHSMTANPLACVASLASLQIMQEEDCLEKVNQLEKMHNQFMNQIIDSKLKDHIEEVRILGSISALHLKGEGIYTSEFGWKLMSKSIDKGVLLRPLGNVIYMTPAYSITPLELEKCYLVLHEVLMELIKK